MAERGSDIGVRSSVMRTVRGLDHYGPISAKDLWGWLSVTPVILLYLVIAIVPAMFALWASFHEIPLLNPEWEFVGLQNYREILTRDEFWSAMWTGIAYMVSSLAVQVLVGLWMALVLNKLRRGNKLLSAVVFTAYLTPTIIIVMISLYMFDPFVGLLHVAGTEHLGLWEGYLFGNQLWSFVAVVLIGSWKFSVFTTIFLLAQLRSIPDHFYEAAKVNGANQWQMFRDITYPRIKGVLMVLILLRSIFMFNKFDVIWPLTEGGPGGATTTMPILAYLTTFNDSSYGEGNAIAVVMFGFLLVAGWAFFAVFNPTEEVET